MDDETVLKYTIPDSDEIEQNNQLLEVDDETALTYTVPTGNMFAELQNVHEDKIQNKIKEKNHITNKNPTESNFDKKNLPFEFIMDSHMHGLLPQKSIEIKNLMSQFFHKENRISVEWLYN